MAICLTEDAIKMLKPKLKAKGAQGLMKMTSKERLDFFAEALGNETTGREIAVSFEKAMVSKQKNAMKKWAENTFPIRNDDGQIVDKQGNIIASKAKRGYFKVVNKIDTMYDRGILKVEDSQVMFESLVAASLGVDITADEVMAINKMTETIRLTKQNLEAENTYANRIAYGHALVGMYDFIQNIAPTKQKLWHEIVNAPKTLLATLDLSAPFRQGFGMTTRKQFWTNMYPMVKMFASDKVFQEAKADILSRPTYKLMKAGGLRISILADNLQQKEDQFMTNLVQNIPLYGNLIRASDRAYSGFLTKLRADVFDALIEKAKLAGENVDEKSPLLKEIASVVNTFTGSGDFGKGDKYGGAIPVLNNLMFSPRKVIANVNALNPKYYWDLPNFARKEAMRNLVGSIGTAFVLMQLALAFGSDEPEDEPISPNFGKVMFGKLRIDVTGGNAGFAVLLAQLYTNESKSSTTDVVRDMGDGKFGYDTGFDKIINFGRNKLSPTLGLAMNYFDGKNFKGDKTDLKDYNTYLQLVTPIWIGNWVQMANSGVDTDMIMTATMFDLFGFGSQYY